MFKIIYYPDLHDVVSYVTNTNGNSCFGSWKPVLFNTYIDAKNEIETCNFYINIQYYSNVEILPPFQENPNSIPSYIDIKAIPKYRLDVIEV
jgi:hypothetical protein